MGRKRAVLVGVNYRGTGGELKGCHNNTARMRRCFVDRFGFDEAGSRVLLDADLAELQRPGDALFLYFSGHGLQSPAETGQDDDTGYDERIMPATPSTLKTNIPENSWEKSLTAACSP
ncbi:hypothetical protein PR202_gb01687 [Eleusine coracana subsp. coracana]|uniref:Peptidase C14 caspase domain-containing protein n=1 Tax=Eleusine coracana subsp. coracana TaxID=191504 RepID=A0AAV5DWI6_ELECO|nr:hypothetical protein PR202_gb01687 [Eleusine coracana subsp. coracana]